MGQHPEVLWAQRSSPSVEEKNVVYLTVNLPDIRENTLEYKLESNKIHFKASAGVEGAVKEYELDLDLFAEVVPESSSSKLTSRSLVAVLRKKEKQEEYWPRLTKEKVRNAFIKTDFSKWVDEDEQDGAAPALDDDDMGGMPPGMMGGMPGMGAMGGMPGMGGPGAGGMDFEKMMAQMGGAGGFDPSAFSAGGPSGGDGGDDSDSDDDGPPPLEDADPSK